MPGNQNGLVASLRSALAGRPRQYGEELGERFRRGGGVTSCRRASLTVRLSIFFCIRLKNILQKRILSV
jgi:hypothetical protein